MHRVRPAILLAWLIAIPCAESSAKDAPPPPGVPIGSLQAPAPLPIALAGCWRTEGDEPGSGEQWTAPAGGTMLGQSRSIMAGRTVFFEHMQIEQQDDGRLTFSAQPKGQAGGRFDAVQAGPKEWVFENRRHSFPQRIAYRLLSRDRVAARIEGFKPDGGWRVVDFPLERTACP